MRCLKSQIILSVFYLFIKVSSSSENLSTKVENVQNGSVAIPSNLLLNNSESKF